MKKIISLISMFLAINMLVGCGTDDKGKISKEKVEKVTLMLDWFPNTNHTGIYVAKEKGYFRELGLDVEIVQPGESIGVEQVVASNKADFGIGYQEGITLARSEGVPVVSVAAVIQHNTSAFASLAKSNITNVKGFENKRYATFGSPIEQAMLKEIMIKNKADFSKVSLVQSGASDFFKTMERDADFMWVYYGWDIVAAKKNNIDVNYLMLKDLDVNFDYYTPVIFTSETYLKDKKNTAKKFIEAVAKGYEYSITNPDESAELLIKNAPELDKEIVMESQKWLANEYKADASRWGEQKVETWKRYADWLYNNKLINNNIEADKAFTNALLP
jgi:ABC-type nitrate/sulfonate/bicarbonate transport system substrate-binding protein